MQPFSFKLDCRLGFAKKKNSEMDSNDLHPSWYDHLNGTKVSWKLNCELSLKKDYLQTAGMV